VGYLKYEYESQDTDFDHFVDHFVGRDFSYYFLFENIGGQQDGTIVSATFNARLNQGQLGDSDEMYLSTGQQFSLASGEEVDVTTQVLKIVEDGGTSLKGAFYLGNAHAFAVVLNICREVVLQCDNAVLENVVQERGWSFDPSFFSVSVEFSYIGDHIFLDIRVRRGLMQMSLLARDQSGRHAFVSDNTQSGEEVFVTIPQWLETVAAVATIMSIRPFLDNASEPVNVNVELRICREVFVIPAKPRDSTKPIDSTKPYGTTKPIGNRKK
jgi:hypothetical protein